MHYLDHNNYKNRFRSGIAVLVVLLFLAGLEFIWPQSLAWLRQGTVFMFKPLTQKLWDNTDDKRVADLLIENQHLRQTLDSLVFEYIDLQTVKSENENLKKALGFIKQTNFNYTTAEIIGEKLINNTNFIIINKGYDDGLQVGQPVMVGEGILIGLISHLDKQISYIVPITENTTALSARILGKDGSVHGVIEGTLGVATHLKLIPKNIDLQPGNIIVTSGFDELIPLNLVIGSAEKIDNESNSFFQSAVVNFLVDYHDYNYVHVIKSVNSHINNTNNEN